MNRGKSYIRRTRNNFIGSDGDVPHVPKCFVPGLYLEPLCVFARDMRRAFVGFPIQILEIDPLGSDVRVDLRGTSAVESSETCGASASLEGHPAVDPRIPNGAGRYF